MRSKPKRFTRAPVASATVAALAGIHWSLAVSAGVLLVLCLTLLSAAMRQKAGVPA